MIQSVPISLLIILIPTILLSCCFNKRIMDVLGIYSMICVLIMLLSGIFFESITVGYYCVLLLSIVSLILLIAKKYDFKNIFKDDSFVLLVIYTVFLIILYRNIRCTNNDEFSHWADIVKIFTIYDDFGTNPKASSGFSSYPPGMSLFQFIFEKTSIMIGNKYQDNLLYVGYQTLLLSFVGPMISDFKDKKSFYLVAILSFLTIPTFYTYMYHSVYIDSFLGIVSGVGLAYTILKKERDIIYHLNVYSYIFMLVLAKDAGLLFAIFLLLVYFVKLIKNKDSYKYYFLGTLSLALPKLLWNFEIRSTTKAFKTRITINDLFVALMGKANDYKTQTLFNFNKRFFSIDLSYPIRYQFLVIGIILIFILVVISIKRKIKAEASLIICEYIVYIFGLLIAYLFNFGEYESVGLASYDRYMCIAYTSLYLCIFYLIVDLIKDNLFNRLTILLLLTYIVFPMPVNYIEALNVNAAANTINDRNNNVFVKIDYLNEILNENDRVFIVCQGIGFETLTYKYNLRPAIVFGGSIYTSKLHSGDIWTAEYTPDELINKLIKDDINYLFLHNINPETVGIDYDFESEYKDIFSGEIRNGGLYRVDDTNKLLRLVN